MHFEELDPRVEKWTEYIYFFNMKFLYPLAMSSIFVISYLMYFFTDAGNDAFELVVLPLWYVKTTNSFLTVESQAFPGIRIRYDKPGCLFLCIRKRMLLN